MRRIVGIVLVLLIVACGGAGTSQEGAAPMRAEIDLYSGRPNPNWDLSAEEAAQLTTRIERLPPISSGEIQEGLGYRGIIVAGSSGELRRVTVSNGVVVVERTGRTEAFADTDRELERWLFQTSKGRIDAAIYELVANELGVP
jgi:hypothetical protein